MATVLDDINAITADSVQLATDQANVVAAQVVLSAAQATVTADMTTATMADQTLSTALQMVGPVFVVNADGSASIYQYSALPPGYTIIMAQPASSQNG